MECIGPINRTELEIIKITLTIKAHLSKVICYFKNYWDHFIAQQNMLGNFHLSTAIPEMCIFP